MSDATNDAITLKTLPSMTAEEQVTNIGALAKQAEYDVFQQQLKLAELEAGFEALGESEADAETAIRQNMQTEKRAAQVALARHQARVNLLTPALDRAKAQRSSERAESESTA